MMKRLFYILFPLLMVACTKGGGAHRGDLIVNGVYNNTVNLPSEENSTFTFTITALYDWSIYPQKGFECIPSSGEAGENISITVRAYNTNNTLQTKELGPLTFCLLNTDFKGLKVCQQPRITIMNGCDNLTLDANKGATGLFTFSCRNSNITLKSSEGISATTPSRKGSSETYETTITTLKDNISNDRVVCGSLSFTVDGEEVEGSVDIFQAPSIATDTEKEIFVADKTGSISFLEIDSPFSLSCSSNESSFTSSIENNRLSVKVLTDNTSSKKKYLGEVTIFTPQDKSVYRKIKVYQRTHNKSTLIFYFLGTALNGYYHSNINSILSAVENNPILDDTRILVYSQSAIDKGTLYEVFLDEDNNGKMPAIINFTLPSVYNGEMFSEQLRVMKEYGLADTYSLIIGSHGKGWIPRYSVSASSLSMDRLWQKAPDALETRHIGDRQATQLDIKEVVEGLKAMNTKLEYILFDACFMGNIESTFDLRAHTKFVVASTCEVLAAGFPYHIILPYMIPTNKDYNLDTVAYEYVEFYKNRTTPSACVSVTDCSKLDMVAQKIKVAYSHLTSTPVDNIQAYDGISYSDNPVHVFFDLEDYIQKCCTDSSAVEGVREALGEAVLSRYHTADFYSAYDGRMHMISYYSGVSTSSPSSVYQEDLKLTAWYKATH